MNGKLYLLVLLVVACVAASSTSDMVVRVKECINNEYSCTKNCTTFDIPQGQCMTSGPDAIAFRCETPATLDFISFDGDHCESQLPFFNQSQYCNLFLNENGPHFYYECDANLTSMTFFKCQSCRHINAKGVDCTKFGEARIGKCTTVTEPITEKKISTAPVGGFYSSNLVMFQIYHHSNCADTGPVLIPWSVVRNPMACGFGFGNSNLQLQCVPSSLSNREVRQPLDQGRVAEFLSTLLRRQNAP